MRVAIARSEQQRPKIMVVFEECHTPMPNHALRSKHYAETVRLITQGGNFGIRFVAITQFSSMVDKLVVKMAQQRYIGKTSEPNDLNYLSGIIGKRISELPHLKRGEFLYSHSGEIGKIQNNTIA